MVDYSIAFLPLKRDLELEVNLVVSFLHVNYLLKINGYVQLDRDDLSCAISLTNSKVRNFLVLSFLGH